MVDLADAPMRDPMAATAPRVPSLPQMRREDVEFLEARLGHLQKRLRHEGRRGSLGVDALAVDVPAGGPAMKEIVR